MKYFYKQRAQIEEEYAKNLLKLCKEFGRERRPVFKGNRKNVIAESPSIAVSWDIVLDSTTEVAEAHLKTKDEFLTSCKIPMSTFTKDMEQKLNLLYAEGTKLFSNLSDSEVILKSSKKEFYKLSHEEAMSSNKGETAKITHRVEQQEVEYRKALQNFNNHHKNYHDSMPKVLEELEKWEINRSKFIKNNIKKFAFANENLPLVRQSATERILNGLEVVDGRADIDWFVEENKSYEEIPGQRDFEPFSLGDYNNREGMLKKVNEKKKMIFTSVKQTLTRGSKKELEDEGEDVSSSKIFGVPIENLKDLNQGIPIHLIILINSIFDKDGFQTEGIFRISGDSNKVRQLKKELDLGHFQVIFTDDTLTVHDPAALLKLWLRELPEPLIVESIYQDALNCKTDEEVFKVLRQLPEENKQILQYLVDFLIELSQEKNVEITKMSMSNLGIVFTPGFLRCPSDDPRIMMSNLGAERSFVQKNVDTLTKQGGSNFFFFISFI
eukprot:Lithocolla_globosa_v1_NODE_1855_length_2294_cov_3.622153.p1 type:complete len:496 gc:universal NODE_1855_length_2294_cov_3.622153:1846-359(-)